LSPADTVFSCANIPIIEKTKTEGDFISSILKFPSMSEIVPLVVPFSRMLTPGIGSPSAVTFPETAFVCAKIIFAANKKMIIKLFFIDKKFKIYEGKGIGLGYVRL
jgi:hypothetical protein